MRWSASVRRQALEAYADHGCAVAHRLTGVPKSTIRFWAAEAGVEPPLGADVQDPKGERLIAWNEKDLAAMRLDLRGRLLKAAGRMVERMDEPYEEFIGPQARAVTYDQPPGSVTRDFAVAAGILIDKFRLESGEASAVVGSVDILPALDDHEKAALADVLRQAIREKTEAAEGAADAVGV